MSKCLVCRDSCLVWFNHRFSMGLLCGRCGPGGFVLFVNECEYRIDAEFVKGHPWLALAREARRGQRALDAYVEARLHTLSHLDKRAPL